MQSELDKNPDSIELRHEESVYLKEFNEAVLDEELFLKRKEKILWLQVGDGNTGYFHKVVKGRQNRAIIQSIRDSNNIIHEGESVPQAFVKHFEIFLGSKSDTCDIQDCASLFYRKVATAVSANMVR